MKTDIQIARECKLDHISEIASRLGIPTDFLDDINLKPNCQDMNKRTFFAALFAAATMGLSAQKPMTAPAGGKAISDELIGIFFEDISSAADGGLYA
jgi:hypothetical protein